MIKFENFICLFKLIFLKSGGGGGGIEYNFFSKIIILKPLILL